MLPGISGFPHWEDRMARHSIKNASPLSGQQDEKMPEERLPDNYGSPSLSVTSDELHPKDLKASSGLRAHFASDYRIAWRVSFIGAARC